VVTFLNQLPIGLSIGAVLLLVALGLSITFGQMGVINMAHGEFLMAGAYTAYEVQRFAGRQAVVVALPIAFAVGGAMGLILERLLIRRFYGRPLDTLLLTYGVSLVLQQFARDTFGAPNVEVRSPVWLRGAAGLHGVRLPYARLFIMVLAAVCVAALWAYSNHSAAGRRMRATVQNRQLAAVAGIHTGGSDKLTFFIGSGLAGVAGVGITLLGSIGPTLGAGYLVRAFLVVVVGGLGQLRGAVLAAIGLGLVQAYGEYWTNASVAQVVVFLAIVAFLQFRPQGLFVLKVRSLQ
jgi:urea transport system permease protein